MRVCVLIFMNLHAISYSLLIPLAANASKNFVNSTKRTARGYLYLIGGNVVVNPYFSDNLRSYFLRCVPVVHGVVSSPLSLMSAVVVASKSAGSAERISVLLLNWIFSEGFHRNKFDNFSSLCVSSPP